jgi:hypothetical protein
MPEASQPVDTVLVNGEVIEWRKRGADARW